MTLLAGIAVLAIFAPTSSSGQEKKKADKGRANPMAAEGAQRGKVQFEQSCAMCHGSEAKGGVGPNLIESSLVLHDEKGSLIGPLLQQGRESKGMPAFPNLSPGQVSDIVTFLHAAVQLADNVGDAGPKAGYSLHRLLTGNVNAGEQYFNGAGGCSHCHSVAGDLKEVAKKYTPAELEGRILFPQDDHRTVTVTLPSGERISGQLQHVDAFYVSLIDAEGNYRSWLLRAGFQVDVHDPLHAHRELLDRYTDKDIHDLFAYLESLHG